MRKILQYLPFIGSIFLIVAIIILYSAAGLGTGNWIPSTTVELGAIQSTRATQLWAISALVMWVALLWNLVFAAVLLAAKWKERAIAKSLSWRLLAAVAGLVIAVVVLMVCFPLSGFVADEVLKPVLTKWKGVKWLVDAGNYATILVIALLACINCILGAEAVDSQPRQLSDSIAKAKYLLLSSATLLAAGLVQIYFLFRWAALYHSGAEVVSFAASITVVAGVLFSTWLIVLFGPLIAGQVMDVKKFVAVELSRNSQQDTDQVVKEHDLHVEGRVLIGRALAAAIPLLIGMLTKVVELTLPHL